MKLLPVYNQGTDPLVVDWASQQQDVVLSAATIQVHTSMQTSTPEKVFLDNRLRLCPSNMTLVTYFDVVFKFIVTFPLPTTGT